MSGFFASIPHEQKLAEAGKAKSLIETEYFLTTMTQMELAAMELAIVGLTEAIRTEARIEVLMLRKMMGALQTMANYPQDHAAAERAARAME